MKKLLPFMFALLSFSARAAIQADLDKGIDLTGLTTVTASQLNQLVANATAATNKGMVIWQNSLPDTANNVRYKRFIWLDSSTVPPTLKIYNTNTSAWVAQTLAANSVTSNNIVDGNVITSKLADASVTTVKIADNAVTDVKISAGAVTTSKIAASAVVSNSVAALAIGTLHIQTNAIVASHITAGVITGDKLAALTITNDRIALGTITSNQIAFGGITLTNISTNTASPAYNLRFKADGTGLEYGRPVVLVASNLTTVTTCATKMPSDNTKPQITEGDQILSVTIAPQSANSELIIRAVIIVSSSSANDWLSAAVFKDSDADAITATTAFMAANTGVVVLKIEYFLSGGSTASRTYKLRVGANSGIAYVNGAGATQVFGGVANTSLSVMEIVQ